MNDQIPYTVYVFLVHNDQDQIDYVTGIGQTDIFIKYKHIEQQFITFCIRNTYVLYCNTKISINKNV